MVQPYSPPGPLPDLPPPTPPQRNRVALVLAVVAAAVIVIVAVSVPLGLRAWHDLMGAGAGESASLDEVHAFGGLSTEHTEDDVDYDVEPPAGGPHDPQWLDCGVYDVPVRNENTVHSLEHGTVWITHRDDVSDEDLARLEELLPDEGILSPYPSQGAAVVVTVWARQLELESADDPRLELFLEEYGDGHTAPEPMASCVGGVDETVSDGVDI